MGAVMSPDGKKLAFNSSGTPTEKSKPGSKRHIWILSVESGTLTRFVQGSRAAWSPDGSEICFARDGDIWKVAVDGGTPTLLLETDAGISIWPRWSPDGSQILLSRGTNNDIWIADVSDVVE